MGEGLSGAFGAVAGTMESMADMAVGYAGSMLAIKAADTALDAVRDNTSSAPKAQQLAL